MDDVTVTDTNPFTQLLRDRPYLADAEITHTDDKITVVYTYAHGTDERAMIAAAQMGHGDPPLRWVRGWLDDWERALIDPTLTIGESSEQPHLSVAGHMVGIPEQVVVCAVPAPSRRQPATNAPHPLVCQLEAEREARGISRPELARQLGYSPNLVWRWAKGASVPKVDALDDMAQFLGYRVRVERERSDQGPDVTEPLDPPAAAAHDALVRLFNVTPGHSMTGPYAQLREDARTIAAAVLDAHTQTTS